MAEEAPPELALKVAEELLEQYRGYLREKNEIIKAYAGPNAMTPEDVAYALEDHERLRAAVRAALKATCPCPWKALEAALGEPRWLSAASTSSR